MEAQVEQWVRQVIAVLMGMLVLVAVTVLIHWEEIRVVDPENAEGLVPHFFVVIQGLLLVLKVVVEVVVLVNQIPVAPLIQVLGQQEVMLAVEREDRGL